MAAVRRAMMPFVGWRWAVGLEAVTVHAMRHLYELVVALHATAGAVGLLSLAGPLVVAGVLLDYELLRGARVRRLAALNDSKQVAPPDREELFDAVVACASGIRAEGGALGVGLAVQNAVKNSVILIIMFGYILTWFFYFLE